MGNYTGTELEQALQAVVSTIGKCEKVLPKLKPGTAQHTLLVRRIKAFVISAELIQREIDTSAKEG